MRKLLLSLILLTGWLQAAPILVATNPELTGAPGEVVDLTFYMENEDEVNYYSVFSTLVEFQTNPSVGEGSEPFVDIISGLGGPVDGVLGPLQNWDDILGTFAIAGSAPVGAVNSITIKVLWDLYSDDPNTCEDCFVDSGETDLTYRITVADTPGEPIPEPGTWAMLTSGLAVAALLYRRRSAAVSAR